METVVLSRRTATVVGLVSTGAALAIGHLVASLVEPAASPFVAVGNSAIDLTPHPVKDFAIRAFGSNDKLVLLAGMTVALALLAVAAGLLSRRRRWPGAVLIAVLGLVGIAAVLDRPDVGALAGFAPVAALAAGVGVFWWLHGLASESTGVAGAGAGGTERTTRVSETHDTPAAAGHAAGQADRRRFLVGAAVTAVGAAVTGGVGALLGTRVDVQASRQAVGVLRPATQAPPIPPGADFAADGTPTFLTPNRDFYRVDTALVVPRIRAEDWELRVHGMVQRELTFRYDDLRDRPLVEKTITLTCVSNEVGGPYISTANFLGVPLRDVLLEAGVLPAADQLASVSADGWTCGTPTQVVLEPDRGALLAIGMNGEPLPVEHGFPVRMVVPGLYGYVSATKWLVELELTTFAAFDPYWARRGWAKSAPIKTMSRIDKPRAFEKVSGGRVVVAGVAWAQHRGIEAVEVQVDGGPWQPATLSDEHSVDTWRMWRTELQLPPGDHGVAARATDSTGYVQTPDRADPIPDGATGWHSIAFSVT